MKVAFKNGFVAVVIVCAMTTQLNAMDPNSTGATVAPADAAIGSQIPGPLLRRDFSNAESHEELRGMARSLGGFSELSLEERQAYEVRRDLLHEETHMRHLRAHDELSKQAEESRIAAAEARAAEARAAKIRAFREDPRAGSNAPQVPTIPPVDPLLKPDSPKKPAGPSRFDVAVKYMREHKLKTATIATGLVLGLDLAYAYRTKVTSEEKQNNRLPRNLLLAAGRTKTAAVLGKLKDFVQSHWAK